MSQRTKRTSCSSIYELAKNEMLTEMIHDMNRAEEINKDMWHRDNQQQSFLNHQWQSINVLLRDDNYIETDCKVEPDYGKGK